MREAIDFLLKLLLAVVNFFIYIGEFTKFLLFLPIRLIVEAHKNSNRAISFLVSKLKKVPDRSKKILTRIRPRKTRLRINLFKPKVKQSRFIRLLSFYLLNKPGALLDSLKDNLSTFKRRRLRGKKRVYPLGFKFRYFLFGVGASFVVVFVNNSYVFIKSLPSPKSIGKINYSLSTHIYDRDGRLLYEFYREQNRTPAKLEDLPSYLWEASIAIEDKDFFKHNGVAPIGGIIRALKENIINDQLQGGSTITQQLVKSALLTPERTIQRKVKEMILALWTERIFNKEQILQMYLNQVPYGGSSYGIEEASKTFFGKSARSLKLHEAALLAGLPQAPSLYSPQINPALSKTRRNEVLKKMQEQKYISQSEYNTAIKQPISVLPPRTTIKAPHFVFFVKSELTERYGIRTVEEGGLRVTTSLDLEIQEKAEEILREEIDKIRGLNVTNGAILIARPQTGEILAMVGSYDYFDKPSGAFNVTTALRQPGSSIKPLMYSLALKEDFTAATILDDTPVVFPNPGGVPYRPVNYDGRFHGRIPLRYALANSYNVPAVKTLNILGVSQFVEHAKLLGISTWPDPSRFGLSLTLGGGEVTMVDMAKAFGVFANMGEKKEVTPIIKIQDSFEKTLYENNSNGTHVLDQKISYIITDILSDNIAR
ncbi:transglycosylase domain-containing protein, partial [Candidatus Roizmanbacteria bacterium]|nr:transglycosylase domain-containing protein [Candidatus Roizmanbacteria bacterium]